MEHVIVERVFAEPVSVEQLCASLQRGESCLTMYRVRFLRTSLSRDGLRMICEYEAPDAESVRLVQQRLGLSYERAWTARVLSAEELSGPPE
jgi:Protein of unknown function (DUF4242)